MNPIAIRLLSQQLICPQFDTPQKVVSHFGAMQAQDYRMVKALKKVPNFKLHSLYLNFNSCPRSISSFKSGILFWTGI